MPWWIFFLHGEVRVKQDQKLYVGISTKLGYHKDTGFLPNHIETMQAHMKKSEHLCIIYIICRMCTQVEIWTLNHFWLSSDGVKLVYAKMSQSCSQLLHAEKKFIYLLQFLFHYFFILLKELLRWCDWIFSICWYSIYSILGVEQSAWDVDSTSHSSSIGTNEPNSPSAGRYVYK